jgi:hypothetical protein
MFNIVRPSAVKCAKAAMVAAGAASVVLVSPYIFTMRLEGQLPHSHERPTYTPCPEVSCKSKEELAAMFAGTGPTRRVRRVPTETSTAGAASGSGATRADQAATPPVTAPITHMPGCPLDREELGRSSWAVVRYIHVDCIHIVV